MSRFFFQESIFDTLTLFYKECFERTAPQIRPAGSVGQDICLNKQLHGNVLGDKGLMLQNHVFLFQFCFFTTPGGAFQWFPVK